MKTEIFAADNHSEEDIIIVKITVMKNDALGFVKTESNITNAGIGKIYTDQSGGIITATNVNIRDSIVIKEICFLLRYSVSNNLR